MKESDMQNMNKEENTFTAQYYFFGAGFLHPFLFRIQAGPF